MNIDHLSIYEKGLMASQPFVLQHSGPKSPFLIKLRSVFSVRSIEHLASWLPEGKIWRIHKIESFINAILPIFVEVSGWETFLLTLASHGFKEVSRGFDSVAFYSEVRIAGRRWRTYTKGDCRLTTCLRFRLLLVTSVIPYLIVEQVHARLVANLCNLGRFFHATEPFMTT